MRESRIKAVMGLAIAARPIAFGANLKNVDVPALLVAGTLDRTSPQEVSEAAFEQLSSKDKAFVSITNATHRTFDSTYCAQMQAAAAIAQANGRAILDRHTVEGIILRTGTSGQGMDYCSFSYFTNPVDIRPLVASITGFSVTADNVPRTGLETEEVKERVKELAVTFFGRVLKPPAPPLAPVPPQARDSRAPAVRASRACTSRSLRARVRVDEPVRTVVVSLNGRRIRATNRASFTVRVPARRLRRGRVNRLTVVATDAAGNRTRRTFRVRACAAKRPRFTG